MLKKSFAIILLFSFTIQALGSQFITLDYYLNTSAYSKNCINKARPALHCNGQCQFMKKLAQHEKKEQQNQEGKSAGKNEAPLSSRSFFSTAPFIAADESISGYPQYENRLTIDISIPVFHPPGV